MAGRGHNGHAWRQLWRAIIDAPDYLVCEVPGCYQPIDRRIRGRQRWAPSVDMIIPWSKGGDPMDPRNLRPAHYGCNSRRSNRDLPEHRPRRWTSSDQP